MRKRGWGEPAPLSLPRAAGPLPCRRPWVGRGGACQCRPPLGLAEGLEWREKAVEDRDD